MQFGGVWKHLDWHTICSCFKPEANSLVFADSDNGRCLKTEFLDAVEAMEHESTNGHWLPRDIQQGLTLSVVGKRSQINAHTGNQCTQTASDKTAPTPPAAAPKSGRHHRGSQAPAGVRAP